MSLFLSLIQLLCKFRQSSILQFCSLFKIIITLCILNLLINMVNLFLQFAYLVNRTLLTVPLLLLL